MKETRIEKIEVAIKAAHNAGNPNAISKKDCEEVGVSIMAWELWNSDVNELRKVAGDFVKQKFHATPEEAKELRKAKNKIFAAWKKLISRADGSTGRIKCNEFDGDSIVGFAETYIGADAGTAWCVQTQLKFRKDIEAYVGCKMTENEVLGDEDRDAITVYKGALTKKAKAEDKLNGYMKGEVREPGILEQISLKGEEIQKNNKSRIRSAELLKKTDDPEMRAYIEGIIAQADAAWKILNAELKDLENQKKQAQENLEKAEKTIAAYKDAAAAANAKIKKLED